MAKVNYTNSLKEEYISMYSSMEINLNKLSIVENHVSKIVAEKARYETVANPLNIPWYFVALIHTMESSRNFKTHLHNGDPLSKRTTHVPAGRPAAGIPPFTWEFSAADALKMKKLDEETDWSLPKLLYNLENYNGWGYRLYHTHVKSPYLWSYCNHYTSGKYIADGTFSNTAVSGQCGAAVILKRMEQRQEISNLLAAAPAAAFFKMSNNVEARADDLQRFLNTFPGISLLVDGKPGPKTSEACFKIMGEYLTGDPRKA